MVSIGILGYRDCGKTALYTLFRKRLNILGFDEEAGHMGGIKGKSKTATADFLRFSVEGLIHVLYSTGGDDLRITNFYRSQIVQKSDEFICMFDLAALPEPQIEFYESLLTTVGLPKRSIYILLNKYDLVDGTKVSEYKSLIEEFFRDKHKMFPIDIKASCAVEKEGYEEQQQNAIDAILCLLERHQK
ncbi:MAG: GTPase domain-containing protein [Candidatus Hermodarchaeota archaeon]